MFGKLIKGLFSGSGKPPAQPSAAAPVLYEGYEIIAAPTSTGNQWQVAGRIEREVDGERQVHVFIRADTLPSADEAGEQMVRKAKLLIDQQGASIFS